MMSLIVKSHLATTLILSSVCIPSASASTLITDPSRITFVGSHCKTLGLEQIKVDDQNKLRIDLSSFPAATAAEPSKGCLIKIPYTLSAAPLAAVVFLRGSYSQGLEDRLTGTLRIGSAGQVGPASIISLSESPQGRFEWQQPIIISRSELTEDTMKISISLKVDVAKLVPGLGGQDGEVPVVKFQPLELIIDHVSIKQP